MVLEARVSIILIERIGPNERSVKIEQTIVRIHGSLVCFCACLFKYEEQPIPANQFHTMKRENVENSQTQGQNRVDSTQRMRSIDLKVGT